MTDALSKLSSECETSRNVTASSCKSIPVQYIKTDGLLWVFPGAGAILSVGLLRSIEWAKMERRFDVDGGVSGGLQSMLVALHLCCMSLSCSFLFVGCHRCSCGLRPYPLLSSSCALVSTLSLHLIEYSTVWLVEPAG